MKIGIDFGTTYTKISYINENGKLELFKFPGPDGKGYIPTALAYRQSMGRQQILIGDDAKVHVENNPDAQFTKNFKMLLPIKEQNLWGSYGWPLVKLKRSPSEVTRDYLNELLRNSRFSFEKIHGKIDSMVVSVPELWQNTPNNPGTEVLRHILEDELKLPVDHLRSEPICAAAYYVHEYMRAERDQRFNCLLLCDMGGGTFDVALSRVKGQKIEVLDFDGAGEKGFDSAGVAFDRESVRLAYKTEHGSLPPENEMNKLLRLFEEVKIMEHDNMAELVEHYDPLLSDTPLYSFGERYKLTFNQAMEVFSPISDSISRVLQRIRERASNRGMSIDRIAIVGGFGQFPLVEQAILKSLNIPGSDDARFDEFLKREHRRFYAVAYGAALIANGLIDPVEYYPHTLGVTVHRVINGRLMEDFLPIVEAGQTPSGQTVPKMACDSTGRMVKVKITVDQNTSFRHLQILLKLHGTGQPMALDVPVSDYPPSGQYFVGVRIDRSNMGILVFESPDGRIKKEYRLGNVNPTLIVEG